MTYIEKLLEVMSRLRDPATGCPWDRVQDFSTIAPYTVEEAYEVADAIAREDIDDLRDELGDLLFQVVFHAQMAKEAGHFDFDDVAQAISEKMLRRHPHVFGNEQERATGMVRGSWEAIKANERSKKSDGSALAGIAKALPALKKAQKLGKRAAAVGFDWQDREGVRAKLVEELAELDEAVEMQRLGNFELGNIELGNIEEEFGDVLFTLVNLARHLGIDPEKALLGANFKFEQRFRAMESGIAEQGQSLADLDPDVLEAQWQAAKQRLRRDP